VSNIKNVQTENRKVNRACFIVAGTPDGKIMLDALRRQFAGVPLRKSPDGKVDPNAIVAAAGSNLVIQTLEEWIRDGKLAR
jgi:hypothetical protein